MSKKTVAFLFFSLKCRGAKNNPLIANGSPAKSYSTGNTHPNTENTQRIAMVTVGYQFKRYQCRYNGKDQVTYI